MSYASWGIAGVAALTAVFAAGYGMGVATRIVTGLLRLALLVALAGGLGYAAYTAWERRPGAKAPAKMAGAATRPRR